MKQLVSLLPLGTAVPGRAGCHPWPGRRAPLAHRCGRAPECSFPPRRQRAGTPPPTRCQSPFQSAALHTAVAASPPCAADDTAGGRPHHHPPPPLLHPHGGSSKDRRKGE